jgi:hypothetical protein
MFWWYLISTSLLCGVLVYENDNLPIFFSLWSNECIVASFNISFNNLFVVLNTIFVGALDNFDVLHKSTLWWTFLEVQLFIFLDLISLKLWNNYINPSILNQWQTLHFIYAQGPNPLMNLLLKSTNWESLKTLGHATSKVKKSDKEKFLYFYNSF